MDIDANEIDRIAELSRIKLNTRDREKFKNQLVKILDYVQKLNELDVTSVKPTLYTSSLKNVFRDDTLQSSYQRKKVIDLSPSHVNGYFKVTKIIE